MIFNLFQDIKWYNVKHKGSHEFGTITDFSVLEMQFYSMFLLSCLGMYSRGSIIMYCLITSFMVHVYCCSFLWHLGHGFFSHQYQRAGGRKEKREKKELPIKHRLLRPCFQFPRVRSRCVAMRDNYV